MSASVTQDQRTIAVQTPLGKDALLLRSLRGEEGISRLFRFELELLSTESKIDYGKLIGKAATIAIRLAGGTDRFFNGVISRFTLVGGEGRFTVYRAELVPWTWLLTGALLGRAESIYALARQRQRQLRVGGITPQPARN